VKRRIMTSHLKSKVVYFFYYIMLIIFAKISPLFGRLENGFHCWKVKHRKIESNTLKFRLYLCEFIALQYFPPDFKNLGAILPSLNYEHAFLSA
jgi:hypothetical protein